MKLRIPHKVAHLWKAALMRASNREIGGVLFGEHVGNADFRIVEATLQERGGSDRKFRRKGGKARRDLKKISLRYDQDPKKFNYLGEWHSHPNTPVFPSLSDELTMKKLVADPKTIVNFLVLLINRLNVRGELEIYACAYHFSGQEIPCEIVFEPRGSTS